MINNSSIVPLVYPTRRIEREAMKALRRENDVLRQQLRQRDEVLWYLLRVHGPEKMRLVYLNLVPANAVVECRTEEGGSNVVFYAALLTKDTAGNEVAEAVECSGPFVTKMTDEAFAEWVKRRDAEYGASSPVPAPEDAAAAAVISGSGPGPAEDAR